MTVKLKGAVAAAALMALAVPGTAQAEAISYGTSTIDGSKFYLGHGADGGEFAFSDFAAVDNVAAMGGTAGEGDPTAGEDAIMDCLGDCTGLWEDVAYLDGQLAGGGDDDDLYGAGSAGLTAGGAGAGGFGLLGGGSSDSGWSFGGSRLGGGFTIPGYGTGISLPGLGGSGDGATSGVDDPTRRVADLIDTTGDGLSTSDSTTDGFGSGPGTAFREDAFASPTNGDITEGPGDGGDVTDVPEPATLALIGTGLIGLGALRRRPDAA